MTEFVYRAAPEAAVFCRRQAWRAGAVRVAGTSVKKIGQYLKEK